MRSRLLRALVVCAACAVPAGRQAHVAAQSSAAVVISEFRTRGPNGGNDEFIELYNRTSMDVAIGGWKVNGSNASGTVSTRVIVAAGVTLGPGCYYLATNSAPGGYSGVVAGNQTYGTGITDEGGIALLTPDNTIVDQVGMSAGSAYKEGTPLAQQLTTNVNRSYERKPGGGSGHTQDTNNNVADFQLLSPSNPQNRSTCLSPVQASNPTGIGAANPSAVLSGETTTLTVTVSPGANPVSTNLSVTADLSAIGGSAASTLFDDGTHGDLTLGDNVFSLKSTVTAAPGAKPVAFVVSDSQDRRTTGSLTLFVLSPPIAIHDVQGSGSGSPYDGQTITTAGIVTAVRSSSFYIEAPESEWDADPNTSEGLAIFTGSPVPAVTVGDQVRVTGAVAEFRPSADPASPPITELSGAITTTLITTGNVLPPPVMLTGSDTTATGGFEQLERYEGMRVRADIVAISPTQGNVNETSATSASTGVFYAVIQGVPRPLREPGLEPDQALPPGAPAGVPRFDGNPERLRVDSDALIGAPKIEIAAEQTINGLTGPLDYSFRSYTILPDPPAVSGISWTPTGNAAAIPVPVPSAGEFTVGHFNMERFFDDIDDPLLPARTEPVLTTTALNGRLMKASLAIRHVLRSPDILGVVEVEDLLVLQRLASQISADAIRDGEADPQYEAFLEKGNDVGGIDVGVLVKHASDRVHRDPNVTQVGKNAIYTQPDGIAALLNDRPPLAIEAVLSSPSGTPYPVTVIVNHLRSLSGVDDTDDGARVRQKRRAQAEFLAAYIQSRQAANPEERIISVGDYNAFEFNDGYVDVMHTIEGTPTPGDQVVLPSADLVEPNLTNTVDLLPAAQRYSFIFDGNAQAIDHVLVNEQARRRFSRMGYARLDADFPESFRNDVTRPERLSDHDAAIAYFAFPEAPVLTLNGDNPMTVEAFTSFTDPGAVAIDRGATPDQDRLLSVLVDGGVDVTKPGTYTLAYTASNGLFETTVKRTVLVKDTIAPVIEGFSVTPASIWPSNHKLVTVTLTYVASDASRVATCMPTVTSSEAPNGTGDGNTAIDAFVVDSRHVQVRAERAGTSRDRIYTIGVGCTDPSGNTAIQTRTVIVPR